MKRYTLKFTLLDSTVEPAQLREEVEGLLLRLHPRITYSMGQVYVGLDGSLLAEIAVDGKRQLIEETFKSKTWKLPVSFESLSWGWLIQNEDATSLVSTSKPLEVDPLGNIQPLAGEGEIPLGKRRLWARYLTLIISTLVLILLLVANAIHTNYPWMQWIYFAGFAIWLFTLNETPFDFRVYAHRINIGQGGLEISYWIGKWNRHLDWSAIWGMDYSKPVCIILSAQGNLRFLASEHFGCQDSKQLLKTIVDRAKLSYVEGNLVNLEYRRPDAMED